MRIPARYTSYLVGCLLAALCVLGVLLISGCVNTTTSVAPPSSASTSQDSQEASENTSSQESTGMLQVRFVDVGQGDCALVSCNDHHLLIDGGPREASQTVYTVLKNEGIDHLDAIIATHPDADHIGGISAALRAATCDTCYCSTNASNTATFDSLLKNLDAQGMGITIPTIPTSFDLGGATVSIIGPVRTFDDDNNNSLVCRVTFGSTAFLFMGDAEIEAERALVRSNTNLEADLIKIGHHGSAYSTTAELLEAVHPAYAIISVGAHNEHGHPKPTVLERLTLAGIDWWRTDESSDIVATSDGQFVYVSPTKEKVDVDASQAAPGALTEEGAKANAEQAAADYVLNTRSHKIHLPTCPSVTEKMQESNKKYVQGTLDEVREQYPDYTLCGNCNPT